MKNYDKLIEYALTVGGLVLVTGLGSYAIYFRNSNISNDPAQWGQLGDYMNFFVSISSLIVVSVLTFTIHKIEQERGETNELEAAKREAEQMKFQKELQDQREKFEYAFSNSHYGKLACPNVAHS